MQIQHSVFQRPIILPFFYLMDYFLSFSNLEGWFIFTYFQSEIEAKTRIKKEPAPKNVQPIKYLVFVPCFIFCVSTLAPDFFKILQIGLTLFLRPIRRQAPMHVPARK